MTGAPWPALVRPKFFAGQMLTDTELNALVDWVADRLALAARRQGRGVVQGMPVRLNETRAGVVVGAGYAVDGQGRDIVIPGDAPHTPAAALAGTDIWVLLEVAFAEESGQKVPPAPLGESPAREMDCSRSPRDKPAATECRDTRVNETFTLTTGVARDASAVRYLVEAARNWSSIKPGDMLPWLRTRLDKDPPTGRCYRRSWESQWPEGDQDRGRRFLELLFWWTVDRIGAPSPVPGPGGGVPLARLHLTRRAKADPWTVQEIDTSSPYRKPFGPEGVVRKPGPADVLGLPTGEARAALSTQGAVVSEWTSFTPEDIENVRRMLEAPPSFSAGDLVTLVLATDRDGNERLVAVSIVEDGS